MGVQQGQAVHVRNCPQGETRTAAWCKGTEVTAIGSVHIFIGRSTIPKALLLGLRLSRASAGGIMMLLWAQVWCRSKLRTW